MYMKDFHTFVSSLTIMLVSYANLYTVNLSELIFSNAKFNVTLVNTVSNKRIDTPMVDAFHIHKVNISVLTIKTYYREE